MFIFSCLWCRAFREDPLVVLVFCSSDPAQRHQADKYHHNPGLDHPISGIAQLPGVAGYVCSMASEAHTPTRHKAVTRFYHLAPYRVNNPDNI